MNAWTRNSFLPAITVLGLIVTSPAMAVIITGSGIDTVTQQFVIDGSASTVTHNPGFIFDGSVAQTYSVSGTFDANFSHYWWSYFQDGDTSGSQGTFIFEQNWLTFGKANVTGNISPSGFALPNYFIFVNGSNLSGNDSACNFPMDPNTSCTGFSTGDTASVSGQTAPGSISIQGSLPISGGALFENFTYDIQANAIPEPAMPMLLLGGLCALLITRRKVQRESKPMRVSEI